MARLAALLRATHLAPSLLVTGLTAALALAAGLGATAALLAAAVLAGQFSIGWANDWLDADRDLAAGRTDKPVVTGAVRASTLRRGALGALGLCVGLSALLGVVPAAVHLAGVAAGWAYDLRLKATLASPLPYALAFALVPGALVVVSLEGTPAPPGWLLAAGALLGTGAHFLNATPDIDVDRAQGVAGLPQRLGARGSAAVGTAAVGAGLAAVVTGPAGAPGPALLAAAGAAVALLAAALALVAAGRTRAGFRAAMGVAALAVGGFVASGAQLP